jgi:hypothetical protein
MNIPYASWMPLQNYNPIYGSFLSLSSFSTFTTPKAIPYDTTTVSKDVRLGIPTSRILIEETAVYKLSYSIQLDRASSSSQGVYIYIKVNGVTVPNSSSYVVLQGSTAEIFPFCEYVLSLNANDYVEVVVYSSSADVTATTFPGTSNYPTVPCIITNIYKVG